MHAYNGMPCLLDIIAGTGMVLKTLHFTAVSNLTTVKFSDTSPNIPDDVHSPVLDDVSVVPGNEGTETSYPTR